MRDKIFSERQSRKCLKKKKVSLGRYMKENSICHVSERFDWEKIG